MTGVQTCALPILLHITNMSYDQAKQMLLGRLEDEAELAAVCPQCGGEVRHRCPACAAPIPSAFAVECEECGGEVRPRELFGTQIRKAGR